MQRKLHMSLGGNATVRLKRFSAMYKFKKRSLRVMAKYLSLEKAADIHETFQMMDSNNKGHITLPELKVGLHKIGHQIADADLQMLMEAVNIDGNGTLDDGESVTVAVHNHITRVSKLPPKP